jgi:hypothetical protein
MTKCRVFVQVGAGAGVLDPLSEFRDGFTEWLWKQRPSHTDTVVLVEPNPVAGSVLAQYWGEHMNVHVVSQAIRPPTWGAGDLQLWYAEEDGPFFQKASLSEDFARGQYPAGNIKSWTVATTTLEEMLQVYVGDASVAMLAIDIEGVDAEVLLGTPWRELNVQRLSFEYIHLNEQMRQVDAHLRCSGFVPAGRGLDAFGLDRLYVRPRSRRGRWIAAFRQGVFKVAELPQMKRIVRLLRRLYGRAKGY